MVAIKQSGVVTLRIAIAMVVATTVAVALRLITKLRTKASILTEDWLAILALLLFSSYAAILVQSVLGGSGGHSLEPAELTLPQLSYYFKFLYATELLFVIIVTAVKLSILSFYRTIFATPAFRKATVVVAGVCLLWFIVFLFVVVFQCRPIKAVWDELLVTKGAGHCISSGTYLFAYEFTNVLIDITILCLPIYMVKKLQLPIKKKFLVCITCIIRISYIYTPESGALKNLPYVIHWSTVELGSAIICACLPTYGPILTVAAESLINFQSWCTSKIRTLTESGKTNSERTVPDGWANKGGSSEALGDTSLRLAQASGRTTEPRRSGSSNLGAYNLDSMTPRAIYEDV